VETTETQSPAAATEEKKFAGKYSTSDELLKGVEEAAKKLGYMNDSLQEMLVGAKESNEFKSIERLYKSLESEIGRRAAAPPAAPTPAPTPSPEVPDTTVIDTAVEGEIVQRMGALTYRQLEASDLAAEMARRGLSIPRTKADLDVLIDTAPYYATRFQNEFKSMFDANMTEARQHVAAQRGVKAYDTQVFDADVQSLRSELQAIGVPFTDTDVADLKARIDKSSFAREERFGVPHLRKGIARAIYMSEVMPGKLVELKNALLVQGREQAIADLNKAKEQNPGSLSTAGLKGGQPKPGAGPKINPEDPDQVSKLTDKQLDYYAIHGRLPN
jgi:hypothetical protein